MIGWLWLDAIALAIGAGFAVLDLDFHVAGRRMGRPAYGALVLGGLLGLYMVVIDRGAIPVPGWAILAGATVYLPFLSSRFIDLELTDFIAHEELEGLLLEHDFARLRHASGRSEIRHGRRRLRLHWECIEEDGELFVELDVHPSLFPITVSRPHVAQIRSPLHLDRIRADILVRRG